MPKKTKNLAILTGTAVMLTTAIPLEAADLFNRNIIAQVPVTQSTPDVLVPNPTIVIDNQPNSTQGVPTSQSPNMVPPLPTTNSSSAPPAFLPRAVAPPVGDIAVSNIEASLDRIDLGTAITVPRLVLRDAPVEEVLKLLARTAGFNIVFTDTSSTAESTINSTVSLDLANESVEEAFNSVLMISGLKANRRGSTIFIGSQLPDGARNLISRTLRLNQVDVESAAVFLASQGAEVQRIVNPVTEVRDPETNRVIERRLEAAQLEPISATQQQGSTAALLLNGLKVSTDERLNSISMSREDSRYSH